MTYEEIQNKISALWDEYESAVSAVMSGGYGLCVARIEDKRRAAQKVTQAAERAGSILEQIEKLEAEAKALEEKSA